MNPSPPRLALASASPRRRALLQVLGLEFRLASAQVDEATVPGETPLAYVERLCQAKARAVADCLADGAWLILTADTTVVLDGQALGKPDDIQQALAMLRRLRDRTHQVLTAFAVLEAATGKLTGETVTSQVHMRDYSEAELAAYVASGDPLDKAGAYAIQHAAFQPVAGLSGCYANVVGLPVCRVLAVLAAYGVRPARTVTCQPQSAPPCDLADGAL